MDSMSGRVVRTALVVGLALLGACGGDGGPDVVEPPPVVPQPEPELPRTYTTTGRAAAGDVFVHLFEWRWPDIEKECTYLAAKGYPARKRIC